MGDRRRLGIMGGTFDPVHLGHLMAAEAARESLQLDHVLFIPTGEPPHKRQRTLAPADDRVMMLRLATGSNQYFSVDTIEIDRPGATYTVDTLLQLRERYTDSPELYFIVGGDTLMELKFWKSFELVARLCAFAVYPRPGVSDERLKAEAGSLKARYDARISFIQGPMADISSSEIRSRAAQGASIKYLVPEPVESYIAQKQLYRGVIIDDENRMLAYSQHPDR
ncbi:MAG TPA: nicotinate-nucleotide adenylyltransferase [Candidatus Atribacteria bacterium]|nr:nicotinate-nucleotide adenylyltransferase [Candidatus Atribacteria bacterium]HPT77669.1 nicotinate-nucleotide adenylyltransferase [Candidatus Atribacteria bacterium]